MISYTAFSNDTIANPFLDGRALGVERLRRQEADTGVTLAGSDAMGIIFRYVDNASLIPPLWILYWWRLCPSRAQLLALTRLSIFFLHRPANFLNDYLTDALPCRIGGVSSLVACALCWRLAKYLRRRG